MPLWRLYRAAYGPGLDGVGGTVAAGRWHTRGSHVIYFGGSASIVVLERLAHTDPDLLPGDLRLARFEFRQSVSQVNVDEIEPLPPNWTQQMERSRSIGDRWLASASACLLVVPSAILPEESNFVLNANHPEAKRLNLIRDRPFTFDSRLL